MGNSSSNKATTRRSNQHKSKSSIPLTDTSKAETKGATSSTPKDSKKKKDTVGQGGDCRQTHGKNDQLSSRAKGNSSCAREEAPTKPSASGASTTAPTVPPTRTTAATKRMDESVHTFAPSTASASGHHRHRNTAESPVMITDALSDVRVNYHIEPKELGHGHYGVVRKCTHRESQKTYAIKSIRKSKVSKIEVLRREIEILKEVKHPHIIELFEVYEDERYLHLITEICTGGELFDRIIAKTQSEEGHFSEHDAARLAHDILDAIRYCHDEVHIVHRDLKPENFLFLTEADNAPIKIIDFGLSRHDDADLGIMQTKVGTPYYVAPEVLRREYTNACDIWSIGVICYILLCGYPPFYGDSDTQIFESVRVGKFDFPSPEWDEISQSAKDFVVLLLKKHQNERPTAAEALKHKWLQEQLGNEMNGNSAASASGANDNHSMRHISHRSAHAGTFTKYMAMKKLKKAALGFIATHLTQAEVGVLEDIFRQMDRNRDGTITLADLDDAIGRGNFSTDVLEDLRDLRRELALSDDDKLNWRDFVAMTMDRSLAMRDDNMKLAFDHFRNTDADYLTVQDLAEIFGGVSQAQEIMDLLDLDGDGKVSFEDFRSAITESIDDEDAEDDSIHSS